MQSQLPLLLVVVVVVLLLPLDLQCPLRQQKMGSLPQAFVEPWLQLQRSAVQLHHRWRQDPYSCLLGAAAR